MGNSTIERILVRSEDLATAIQRNGAKAGLAGSLSEVKAELFGWAALEGSLSAATSEGISEVATHKAIVRSDNGNVVGIVGKNYSVHSYGEWLADNISNIVDDSDVVVQSAGLLGGGSKAYVQIAPGDDAIDMGAGFMVRPFILGATSLDGSTPTLYKRNAIAIVCQNTYSASMAGGSDIRIKHTRNSSFKLETVRDALGVLFSIQDEFQQTVQALLETEVSNARFEAMVTEFLGGKPKENADSTRGQSIFDRKFDSIVNLWNNDMRVAPWQGTGLGAVQAFSTWQQNVADVRGATRAERNAERLLSGAGAAFDADVLRLVTA